MAAPVPALVDAEAPEGAQRTWPQCLAAGVAAYAVCRSAGLSKRATAGWSLLAFYLPSYLDGAEYTGERYWPWYADVWKRIWSSIPTTLVAEVELDPAAQYIFGSHPHGVLSAHHGIIMCGSSKPSFHDISPMHKHHNLAASVVFRVPLFREYSVWQGCVDASRFTAEKMLQKGKSLVIGVGGITEQMLSQRGEQVIYVSKRKGHIRLALKYGVPIVPCYTFGETELYTHSKMLLAFRQWFAMKFSVALLIAYGSNKLLPFIPHKGAVLNQVLGRPIPVEKNDNPTQEEVDRLHQAYVDELVRIFNKYKRQYGYGDQELTIL